jgi:MinD-like ATPase involved in chromosome partitioning or flagellar assembly
MTAEIWVIGGGKGGTGKSFVTSTMGMNLAFRGKKVTLIDADLGGANLHTFLSIKKPKYSLTDFFEKKIPLSDIIQTTEIPNLRFVTGDVGSLDSSGVRYVQKIKLYRHIRNISGDYVLIDLGAGSGHNTIDTFVIADKMIVVTLPEITAIENLYMFIISSFKLYIIMNGVKNNQHIETGFSTKSVIHKYFEIDARYIGYIQYNEFFWKFVKQSPSFKQISSPASTSLEVRKIVQSLLEGKQLKLADIPNE